MSDRRAGLGLIFERSAMMELQIQDAFCALAGSKVAAAVAGDQTAGWLIEKCEALADAHQELPDTARQEIKDALRSCRAANARRIDLVHGVQAVSRMRDGSLKTSADGATKDGAREDGARPDGARQDGASDHEFAGWSWTIAELQTAGRALQQAGVTLSGAIQRALRPESIRCGEALRREEVREASG